MSRSTPWAIILCRFSDDTGAGKPQSINYYTSLFGGDDPDSIPSFWRDVTYGELDLITGTEVTPWLTIPHKRSDAYTLPTNDANRSQLEGWVEAAAADAGVTLSRFFGYVAFFAVGIDLYGAAGGGPRVVCDVLSSPSQMLQEYGHAYGLQHSRSVVDPTDYKNPYCIMSGLTFGHADDNGPGVPEFANIDPTFSTRYGNSGPALCSPYLAQAGWLAESRVVNVSTDGTHPRTTVISLSPLGDMAAARPQAAVVELSAPQPASIYVEYRRGGWDRALQQDPVVIHHLRADTYAYYAGHIETSTSGGVIPGAGPSLLPGKWYVDTTYDLSVELVAIQDDGETVTIRVAPAAAAHTLSVRAIARAKLQLPSGFSIGTQVLGGHGGSLRTRLVELLGA